MNKSKVIITIILFFVVLSCHERRVTKEDPARIDIIYYPNLGSYDFLCYEGILQADTASLRKIHYTDSVTMHKFQEIYSNLQTREIYDQDSLYDGIYLREVIASYKHRSDTLMFLHLFPEGEIKVRNQIFKDSLMYQYVVELIAQRDSVWYNLERQCVSGR